ncbi:MAG: hypothetical protein HOE87_04125 [Candidatus Magasanikbacteria bacterium]|nr:hypothetical protein [Candidatus Magasanikbacteria bacterium]
MAFAIMILVFVKSDSRMFLWIIPVFVLASVSYLVFLFVSGQHYQEGPFGPSELMIMFIVAPWTGARADIQREDWERERKCREEREFLMV